MTVFPSAPPRWRRTSSSGSSIRVVVGNFAAYIAGRALQPGTPYLPVFRFAGCTAFIGYSLALWQNTIW